MRVSDCVHVCVCVYAKCLSLSLVFRCRESNLKKSEYCTYRCFGEDEVSAALDFIPYDNNSIDPSSLVCFH